MVTSRKYALEGTINQPIINSTSLDYWGLRSAMRYVLLNYLQESAAYDRFELWNERKVYAFLQLRTMDRVWFVKKIRKRLGPLRSEHCGHNNRTEWIGDYDAVEARITQHTSRFPPRNVQYWETGVFVWIWCFGLNHKTWTHWRPSNLLTFLLKVVS